METERLSSHVGVTHIWLHCHSSLTLTLTLTFLTAERGIKFIFSGFEDFWGKCVRKLKDLKRKLFSDRKYNDRTTENNNNNKQVLPVSCLRVLLSWGLWCDGVLAHPTACLHLKSHNRPGKEKKRLFILILFLLSNSTWNKNHKKLITCFILCQ